MVNRQNFVYRKNSNVHISNILWHVFRGGHDDSWATSRTGFVDMDDVVITSRK